jgi:hypothetical protein
MSPSKCRIIVIHETGSQNGCKKKVQIYEKGEMKSPNEFRMFHKFLNKHENNGLGPCIRTFNLFQDVRFSRKSGIRKSQKSGIRKSRKSGIMNRRSSGITDLRNYAFRSPKFGSHE